MTDEGTPRDDEAHLKPNTTVRCGSPGFSDCLLNQLAACDSGEWSAAICRACGQSAAELEEQSDSVGKHIRNSRTADHEFAPLLQMIERDATAPRRQSGRPVLSEIGPYDIGEMLGEGGMGTVYRATHRRLQKDVAIKLLPATALNNATAVARFSREMEAVGTLEHPHVVRALDAGTTDGTSYLVMELVSGTDLAHIVADGQRLKIANACEITRQAAIGLHHAHQQGLVHRDVKPGNLMLSQNPHGVPTVKVMDLGLALRPDAAPGVPLTDQGQLMGTLEFMAPEQATHSAPVDHRADIYALGATLFRLLTGTVPFSGAAFDSPVKRFGALTQQSAPSIETHRNDLPPGLVALVDSMLSRRPDRRPQSMVQVAERLERFSRGHDLAGLKNHRVGPTEPVTLDAVCSPVGDTAPPAGPTVTNLAPLPLPPPEVSFQTVHGGPRRPAWWWVCAAALPMLALLLGLIWLKTDGGYIRIEADPGIDVSVDILKDGTAVGSLEVGHEQHEAWYRTGSYEIRLPAEASDRLTIQDGRFTLARGSRPIVRISRVSDQDRQQDIARPSVPATGSSNLPIRTVANLNDQGGGSIRQIISEIPDGGIIRFDESLAGRTIVLTSGHLEINKSLTIDAGGLSAPVTLDAAGLSRVILCRPGHKVSLSDLVITGGNADQLQQDSGGGILSEADLTLTRVTVTGNTAVDAVGGIDCESPGSLTMSQCTVSNNSAPVGGGLRVVRCNYSIRDTLFVGNTATRNDAAFRQVGGSGMLTNCTITENTAPEGTGFTVGFDGHAALRNVTITNNTASTIAPAWALTVALGARLELENCVVAANGFPQSRDVRMVSENSVLATSGTNLIGTFHSEGGHVLNEDVITDLTDRPLDPRLARLGDYGGPIRTMPPLPDSPLIDTGMSTGQVVPTDARGSRRPLDGDGTAALDVGAVEFNNTEDLNLSVMDRRPSPTSTNKSGLPGSRRLLKIQHLFVRNEGETETLEQSECRIIPFVTYPGPKTATQEQIDTTSRWRELFARRVVSSEGEFKVPDWVTDSSRIALPRVVSAQKPAPIECEEGNHWSSAKFNNSLCLVELSDNPDTPDRDETLEAGFLFISRFSTKFDSAEFFEFKTLAELNGRAPETHNPSWDFYTASVGYSHRKSRGLMCGKGLFQHYVVLEFVDSSDEQQGDIKPVVQQ